MQRIIFAAVLTTAGLAQAADFTLVSPEIKADAVIPKRFGFKGFGCAGDNKSPFLKWSGAPPGTKSFAVTVYDPDAPSGSGWWHWSVVNIPASVTELASNAGDASGARLPKGAVQLPTDYGAAAWGGMCPPQGDKPHRYVFTVYAMKTDRVAVLAAATGASTESLLTASALGQASFTARYGRAK